MRLKKIMPDWDKAGIHNFLSGNLSKACACDSVFSFIFNPN